MAETIVAPADARVGDVTGLLKHRVRDESAKNRDAEGNQNDVVKIAKDGNWIGNQVDGAESVGEDTNAERFGVPGRARVPTSEIKHVGFSLEIHGALFARLYEAHTFSACVCGIGPGRL